MINICHLQWIKSITTSVINLPIIRMNQNVLKASFLMITLDNENDTPECVLRCFTIAMHAIYRRTN